MRRARVDPASAALIRALRGCSAAALVVETAESAPWASATFIGATHRLTIAVDGPAAAARADTLVEMLPTLEFALHGHLVADINARRCDGEDGAVRMRIEALTVEE